MYLRVVKFPGLTALAILERPLGTTIQQSHESGHVLVSTIIMNEDKRAVKPSGCHFGSVLSDDVKGGSANVERLISSAKVSEICPECARRHLKLARFGVSVARLTSWGCGVRVSCA
jgi:hypothetical protein